MEILSNSFDFRVITRSVLNYKLNFIFLLIRKISGGNRNEESTRVYNQHRNNQDNSKICNNILLLKNCKDISTTKFHNNSRNMNNLGEKIPKSTKIYNFNNVLYQTIP